jgi:hypothetical protein
MDEITRAYKVREIVLFTQEFATDEEINEIYQLIDDMQTERRG